MARQHPGHLAGAVTVERLERGRDPAMERLALRPRNGGIRHVVGECVLERVAHLGKEALLVDELDRAKLAEQRVGRGPALEHLIQNPAREFPADDGGQPKQAPGPFGQPVDPRGDDVLDGVGHEGCVNRARHHQP